MRTALWVSIIIVILLTSGASFAAAPLAFSQSSKAKMTAELASDVPSLQPSDTVRVIIKYKPGSQDKPLGKLSVRSGSNISDKIRLYGGHVRYEYNMTPSLSASVPAGAIDAIASDESVERVYLDIKVHIARSDTIPLMAAGNAATSYGVNGTGINISIIDTGIYNHSELVSPLRIAKEHCFCTGCCNINLDDESDTAVDQNGHGTHVAGIAAGQGNASYGYGVATNATIFDVKVLDAMGNGYVSDVIKGMEWSAANGANIISMSLGVEVSVGCYEDTIMPDYVDNLSASGILFVVAAGNCGPGGSSTCTIKGDRTVTSPGCAKSALTVGATTKADAIASYSSRGATLDNRTKPDVIATGSSITSTYLNNGYTSSGGTSMATPFVSGEAALIMQRYRQVYGCLPDPSLVKAIIMTGVNATSQRNNTYGSGRIDVNKSLGIITFSLNGSLMNGQMINRTTRTANGTLIVTLYWPENSSTSNNLDLIVGNSTVNFTQATDANDTVEQVTLFNAQEGIWNMYVNGTNITGSQRYFLVWLQSASIQFWLQSASIPFWYGNKTITTAVYNATNLSYFNISWGSDIPLSSVIIEGDWSGSAANYTMTPYGGVNYSYSAILPDGTFYWRSWANDTTGNLNVTDNWTFTVLNVGPNITDASVFPTAVLAGDNITVFANASDYSLDGVWLNIYNSSGFGAMSFMHNASARFNATYNTSDLAVGLYNITVFANDTRNNVTNMTTGLLNVTVPRNITMSFLDFMNAPTNVSVIFFYNGTATARNQTSKSTDFTSIVPEGLWDIRISSAFNATLFDVNTSANVTGNITIDIVPNSNAALPGFVPIEVVAMESGISFTNATIIIPNSSITSDLNISVMACHSWNMSNRSCDGAWENATANSSISAGLASLYTMNLSAFAVMRNTTCGDGFVDGGETTSSCCQDTGCPSGQSCSASGTCYTTPSAGSGYGTGGSEGVVLIVCNENWTCGEWPACSSNGVQTRACTDSKGCGTAKKKPDTNQSCVYSPPEPSPAPAPTSNQTNRSSSIDMAAKPSGGITGVVTGAEATTYAEAVIVMLVAAALACLFWKKYRK